MADKLMYILNDDTQEVPKDVKLTNKKTSS